MVMVAFGTTALFGSTTTPVTVPELSPCGCAVNVKSVTARRINITFNIDFDDILLSEFSSVAKTANRKTTHPKSY
jgi:hypothetical protein